MWTGQAELAVLAGQMGPAVWIGQVGLAVLAGQV